MYECVRETVCVRVCEGVCVRGVMMVVVMMAVVMMVMGIAVVMMVSQAAQMGPRTPDGACTLQHQMGPAPPIHLFQSVTFYSQVFEEQVGVVATGAKMTTANISDEDM